VSLLAAVPFLGVVTALPSLAWGTRSRLADLEGDIASPVPLYLQTVLIQVVLTGFALVASWGVPVPFALGARPTSTGVLLGCGLVAGWMAVSAVLRPRRPPEVARLARLIRPRTGSHRLLWFLTMAAAALGEEIAYRGVLFGLGASVLGGWWAAALLSAVLFGLAHLAQGWVGLIASAAFGLGLQGLVLVTGGLGVAIAVHLAYDVLVQVVLNTEETA